MHAQTSQIDFEPLLNSAILDAFPNGVLVCDPMGRILHGNAELHRLFGYDEDELLGASVTKLLPEDKRGQHQQHLLHFFATPQRRTMGSGQVLYGQRKDGSTFPIEIGLNPIETPFGMQVIASIADITSRLQLQQNFEKIIHAAPVGMLIINQEGIITLANTQLMTIFGYRVADLVGQKLEMLLPERHRDKHFDFRNGYLAQPTVRAMGMERDLTGLHKSGREFPVEIGLNPIQTDKGRHIVATITDITQRKKAELKLKQLNSDLDEFTYVASHDLKSPLRGINSLLEWIEEDLGDNISTEVRHNLDRVHLRIERMEKLVEDLLAYARSGRQQVEAEKLELKSTIEDVIQLLSLSNKFVITASGFLGEIHTYRTPLETVLRNLIGNAVKHHDKENGNIKIHVSADGSYCVFDILDDGPGIPTSAHERIFKLFQTLSNQEGTRSGVGLAVCKRMVEAHGGKIEVITSDDMRGACFRFWWPRFSRSDINE